MFRSRLSRPRRAARSRPAKIAYVCHVFPHLTQTFVYREVEELRRAGIALAVFSMKPADVPSLSQESRNLMSDTVYLARVMSAATAVSQLAWLLRAPRRYLQALVLVAGGRYRFDNGPVLWLHGMVDFARGAHLARLIDRDGAFCHLHAQFADHACTTTLVASLLTGIPFSFRNHTSPNPQIIAEKVRRAQFVVSISRYDKRVLVHWCGEPAAAKIHINYLGVPLDRYVPGSGVQDRQRTSTSTSTSTSTNLNTRTPEHLNTPPLILSIGTLCAKKGFEDLIRACRLLTDRGARFRCLIVGSGPLHQRLTALIEDLGLDGCATLAPYTPQEELRGLFREAAIFTLPCIFPLDGNVDGTPVVLMEAMAMGLPVVSTAVSGIPELVRHELDGLLVPEKDDEALAEALERLLRDPELARRLGAAARETVVRRFDEAVNVAELAEILRGEVPELAPTPTPFPSPDFRGGALRARRRRVRSAADFVPPPPAFGGGGQGVGARAGELAPSSPDPALLRARRLRVAWIAEIPVPYRVGLYRRLREEAGLDLRLFFCSATQADRDWTVRLEGVPHVVLRGATAAVRPREQFFLRINPQVWPELSRFKPEVVVVGGYAHVTMQLAILWCRLTGTPYVINSETHGRGSGQWGGTHAVGPGSGQPGKGIWQLLTLLPRPAARVPPHRPLATVLKRFYIRGAAAGLPAGTLAREYLVAHGGPAERMFLLPNTCPVGRFARESAGARCRRAALRVDLGLGPGPVLLYVGRLTPVKGLDTLLRAFAAVRCSGVQVFRCSGPTETGMSLTLPVPNTRTPEHLNTLPVLLLVGDGEQRRELEALARSLGVADRVRFAGSRPWDELPALYAAADLFVLPSTFEPWGAVVSEALACGLPVVVSSQVGCAPDLVRPGENGWVVPAGDVDALAAVLREALAEPARLPAMGAVSARLATHWGEDACLEAFVAAVKAAAGVRGQSLDARRQAPV